MISVCTDSHNRTLLKPTKLGPSWEIQLFSLFVIPNILGYYRLIPEKRYELLIIVVC